MAGEWVTSGSIDPGYVYEFYVALTGYNVADCGCGVPPPGSFQARFEAMVAADAAKYGSLISGWPAGGGPFVVEYVGAGGADSSAGVDHATVAVIFHQRPPFSVEDYLRRLQGFARAADPAAPATAGEGRYYDTILQTNITLPAAWRHSEPIDPEADKPRRTGGAGGPVGPQLGTGRGSVFSFGKDRSAYLLPWWAWAAVFVGAFLLAIGRHELAAGLLVAGAWGYQAARNTTLGALALRYLGAA